MSKERTLVDIEEEYEKLSPELKQYIEMRVRLKAFSLKYENLPARELKKRDFKTEVLYPRFEEIKDQEGVSREEAFDRLYKTCRIFDKEADVILPDDPHSFFRSYNRWKERRIREMGT